MISSLLNVKGKYIFKKAYLFDTNCTNFHETDITVRENSCNSEKINENKNWLKIGSKFKINFYFCAMKAKVLRLPRFFTNNW
jgi:hypothetical protein